MSVLTIQPPQLCAPRDRQLGEQWRPSNMTEGCAFIESWCTQCQRDRAMREGTDIDDCDDEERCDIIAASFAGEAHQWRHIEGLGPVCAAFVPAGEVVKERCAHTPDMFGGESQ